MSLVRLEAYVAAKKVNGGHEAIHGTIVDKSDDFYAQLGAIAAGRPIISFDSVMLPHGKPPPKGVLSVMLYGFRDALEEINERKLQLVGSGKGAIFQTASIDFDVGDIYPGVIHEEELPGVNFANLRRMSASVQHTIRDFFEQYIHEEGGDVAEVKRIQQIAKRPDLFGRLLNEEQFKHLGILVIPIEISTGRMRQFALVTKNAIPVALEQNTGLEVLIAPPREMRILRPA